METLKANYDITKTNYTFISDKSNLFSVELRNEYNSINAIAVFKGEILTKKYEKSFSLNDLAQNKYLSLFESTKDIYEEITNIIKEKSKEVKIIEETNQIIIHIPLISLKFKEITLCLDEKKKDEKEQIRELYDIIADLRKENITLKNNQKKLEEILEDNRKKFEKSQKTLENKVESLLNDIKLWKEYKEKVDIKEKEKNENKKVRNMDSLVLGDNEKYNMIIKNWINPNLKIKAKLLYRLSRDGKEYQTFHNLCDNRGNTLIIFKLNDGNILGGYTTKDWDNCQNWKPDQNAFLFSLNENVKCVTNSNNSYNAIYCNNTYGPYFNTIRFYNKKMDEAYICQSSYYNDSNRLYPGKQGDYYKCQEVEVYKILIN